MNGKTYGRLVERRAGLADRTQHRRRWRGKRFSCRFKVREPADFIGQAVDRFMQPLIAQLWRAGKW